MMRRYGSPIPPLRPRPVGSPQRRSEGPCVRGGGGFRVDRGLQPR